MIPIIKIGKYIKKFVCPNCNETKVYVLSDKMVQTLIQIHIAKCKQQLKGGNNNNV